MEKNNRASINRQTNKQRQEKNKQFRKDEQEQKQVFEKLSLTDDLCRT